MDKSVMLSIKPEWCAKIVCGIKTVEIRKTRPKLDPPFKCYIYCSHSAKQLLYRSAADRKYRLTKNDGRATLLQKNGHTIFNGCVIGEFICDEIKSEKEFINEAFPHWESCLSDEDLVRYAGYDTPLFYWHISDLVIYDEPKSLDEFHFPPERYCEKQLCGGCPYDQVPNEYGEYAIDCEWKRPMKRPPQSWCYVKEVKK